MKLNSANKAEQHNFMSCSSSSCYASFAACILGSTSYGPINDGHIIYVSIILRGIVQTILRAIAAQLIAAYSSLNNANQSSPSTNLWTQRYNPYLWVQQRKAKLHFIKHSTNLWDQIIWSNLFGPTILQAKAQSSGIISGFIQEFHCSQPKSGHGSTFCEC
jgi:hypothetical protein